MDDDHMITCTGGVAAASESVAIFSLYCTLNKSQPYLMSVVCRLLYNAEHCDILRTKATLCRLGHYTRARRGLSLIRSFLLSAIFHLRCVFERYLHALCHAYLFHQSFLIL